jgi:hypothetical protein
MDEYPEWPGALPESLTESDFLYALAIDQGPEKVHERAAALWAYGTFLAESRRRPEAEKQYLAPLAEHEFRAYLDQRPEEPQGHLRLAEVLQAQGKLADAAEAG